jgi:hypothetical protein
MDSVIANSGHARPAIFARARYTFRGLGLDFCKRLRGLARGAGDVIVRMGFDPFRALDLRGHEARDHVGVLLKGDRRELMAISALNYRANSKNQFKHDILRHERQVPHSTSDKRGCSGRLIALVSMRHYRHGTTPVLLFPVGLLCGALT